MSNLKNCNYTKKATSLKKRLKADLIAFFICLITSIGLAIWGFYTPPLGVIDGSVITTIGMLLGFATLGVAAQAIKDGRIAKFSKGDIDVTIGKTNTEEYERNNG